MLKYQNATVFLSSHFEMVSTLDDYINTKRFIFRCKEFSHSNELSTASFSNKRYKVKLEEFCIGCVKEKENQQHTKEYINTVKEKTGHTVLSADFTTRKVTYQCGTCDSVSESFTSNLLNINTGVCGNCQNWKFKLPYEKLKSDVESYGMKLITAPDQYTGNKQMMDVMCECGKPYQMILSSIRQGKKCLECKSRKFKETCMERYGVENVMHVPEIFEHNQSSCFRRKIFMLPSGKEIILMGYEPAAIQELLDEGNTEEQLCFGKDIPTFSYKEDGINRIYYPDCYIPEQNMLIEVKSNFTFFTQFSKNIRKFISVIEKGYSIRLIVYDDRNLSNGDILKKIIDITFYTTHEIDDWISNLTLTERQATNIDRFIKSKKV
jgi:hypothetical protein